MKTIKTITKYKCDICHEEKEIIKDEKLLVNWGYMGQNPNYIILNAKAYISYGTTNGDVCKDCLIKYMKKYIEEYNNNLFTN